MEMHGKNAPTFRHECRHLGGDFMLRISANKQTSRTLAHKKRTEPVTLSIRKTVPTFWGPRSQRFFSINHFYHVSQLCRWQWLNRHYHTFESVHI